MSAPSTALTIRRVVISVVAVAIALTVGVQGFRHLKGLKEKPERRPGGSRPPVVRVVVVERRDFRETLRGYGVARAMREATIAAEVGGIVRAVAPELEVGRQVSPPPGTTNGQGDAVPLVEPERPPLVRLDDQDLKDVLARLAAERLQAEADRARLVASVTQYGQQVEVMTRRLGTARGELRRILTLVGSETLSESDADRQRLAVFALEQAEAELVLRRDDTQAQIAVVDARLQVIAASQRKAGRDLVRTRIYSPYTGRVVARHVERGALVAPGTPLFDLVDPTLVEVAIALPASRHGQIHTGRDGEEASHVTLRLGEGEAAIWTGPVRRVDPGIDPDSRTFHAYVEIDDPDGRIGIAPGAHLVADVKGTLHRDVLVVPREAFVDDDVFVTSPAPEAEDPAQKAGDPAPEAVAVVSRRRPTVRTTLLGVALVQAGGGDDELRPGDHVVVTNLEDVADGSKVRVLGAAQ